MPVFVGHSEAINIEFEDFLDEDEARDILREAPGVLVVDKREPGGYVTPVECVGEYATYVSRIRQDSTIDNGLSMWVRLRQPAQGRGAQRRPDRRASRPPGAEEGLTRRPAADPETGAAAGSGKRCRRLVHSGRSATLRAHRTSLEEPFRRGAYFGPLRCPERGIRRAACRDAYNAANEERVPLSAEKIY